MNGQWIGRFGGTTSGQIILNVDDCGDWYQGTAFLLQDDNRIANSLVGFSTITKKNEFKFTTKNITALNRWPGLPITIDQMQTEFPHSQLPEFVEVEGKWTETNLLLNWKSNLTIGNCNLKKTKANAKSKISSKKVTWDGFKRAVAKLENRRFIFRGQQEPWRLRTSFHRTNRTDIQRFINDDIRVLHRHLSARTKHTFNLEIPNENGAFFNLVQHHGYPTPLLDWTLSPYVAAFFAFRNISKDAVIKAEKTNKVRIIMFDQDAWRNDYNQLFHLSTGILHFSMSEFLAIENERMIPQQAVSAITNIDDIETYIQECEKQKGKQYLCAFDLPLSERDKVLQELRYMGITAGSLFPGLDGACEELKNRNFDL